MFRFSSTHWLGSEETATRVSSCAILLLGAVALSSACATSADTTADELSGGRSQVDDDAADDSSGSADDDDEITPATSEKSDFITGGDEEEPEAVVCATASAESTLMQESLDVILALDNSGSVSEELQSVEDNRGAHPRAARSSHGGGVCSRMTCARTADLYDRASPKQPALMRVTGRAAMPPRPFAPCRSWRKEPPVRCAGVTPRQRRTGAGADSSSDSASEHPRYPEASSW